MPCIIVLDVSFMRMNDSIAIKLAKLQRDFVCLGERGGGGTLEEGTWMGSFTRSIVFQWGMVLGFDFGLKYGLGTLV